MLAFLANGYINFLLKKTMAAIIKKQISITKDLG
jgi:hypothetical protein